MIKQWIDSYGPKNIQETEQALREIMQEITLAGLYRANFFKYAAFYGGTALRIDLSMVAASDPLGRKLQDAGILIRKRAPKRVIN